jgi:Sugar-transfer associated ATP-grasp
MRQDEVGFGRPGSAKPYGLLQVYPALLGEIARHEPAELLPLVAQMIWCRIRHDLGPLHFLNFDLRNRPSSTWGDYIGDAPYLRRTLRALHPPPHNILADDKVLSTERFVEHGVPVAPIIVVAGRDTGRHHARFTRVETSVEGLAQVVEAPETPDRLFCKPAGGTLGRDVFLAVRNGSGWIVDERSMSTRELAARILAHGDAMGTIVAPELRNHPDLRPITGDLGLSVARILTARTTRGIELFCTLQKVMTSRRLVDNFGGGGMGNVLCFIDPDSGRISAALGRRPGRSFLLDRFETHTLTGHAFEGFQLPGWPEMVAVAKAAAEAIPELPLLGLDIAMTRTGALALEANITWYATFPSLQRGGLRRNLMDIIPRLNVDEARRADALWALTTGRHHHERGVEAVA